MNLIKNKKIQAIILIILSMSINISCSILQRYISENLDIEQGIYLTEKDIQKFYVGMTQAEILNNIGHPILQDIFKPNKWYYIYYHYQHNKLLDLQIIELSFDLNEILISINKL